jgi:hypothetical protein
MFTMSGHLKYIFSSQRCVQTFATLRSVLRIGGIRTCETKHNILRLFPSFRTVLLPNQTLSFSTEDPRSDVVQSQDERSSDTDDDNALQYKDILVEVIEKGKQLSSSEWQAVKDQVYAKNRDINCYNIDAIIIGICVRLTQLDMGLSYLEHLSVSGRKLNIATIAQVMKMCYVCRMKGIDEELILSMYEDLRSRCPVLDAYTAESAVLGMCLTKHWKVGLDLLEMTKLTCTPGMSVYNALVKTAYDHNEPNISQQLINEMLEVGRYIMPEVFHAELNYFDRISTSHELERWKLVEELLMMLVENDLKPTKDVAERIRAWYSATAGPNAEVHAEFSTLTGRYEIAVQL